MSRLRDRAVARMATHISDKWASEMAEVYEQLKTAIVINAQNVATYYFAQSPLPGTDFNLIGGYAPPFEKFFIEFELRRAVAPHSSHLPSAVGVLILPFDVYSFLPNEDREPGGARWINRVFVFSQMYKSDPVQVVARAEFYVSEDGRMVPGPTGQHVVVEVAWDNEDKDKDIKDMKWTAQAILCPSFTTIAFANCKNVNPIETLPPARLSRKHEKKYGSPLTRYYTLHIGSIGTPRSTVKSISEEAGRSLHICRGHFATYSEEKPLFGKYAGTYWKPQHIRGAKKYGEVIKDYTVEAPKVETRQ